MLTIQSFINLVTITGSIAVAYNIYIIINLMQHPDRLISNRNTILSFFIACLTALMTLLQMYSLTTSAVQDRNILIAYKVSYLILILAVTILYMNLFDFLTMNRKKVYILRIFLIFMLYLPLTICLVDVNIFSIRGILDFYLLTNLMSCCCFLVVWSLMFIKNRQQLRKYGLAADVRIINGCSLLIIIYTGKHIVCHDCESNLFSIALLIVALFLPNLITNGTIIILTIINQLKFSDEELKNNEFLLMFDEKERLTPRENEILTYILAGTSAKEIANILFLSVRTVEKHIQNIYAKYNVQNKFDLMAYFQDKHSYSSAKRKSTYPKKKD